MYGLYLEIKDTFPLSEVMYYDDDDVISVEKYYFVDKLRHVKVWKIYDYENGFEVIFEIRSLPNTGGCNDLFRQTFFTREQNEILEHLMTEINLVYSDEPHKIMTEPKHKILRRKKFSMF
jgi:hypothetical protein